MDERSQFSLGKQVFPVVRYKLRDWLRLDTFRSKILKAAEAHNRDEMEVSLYSYVSAASGLTVEEVKEFDWWETTAAFAKVSSGNIPNQSLPMLAVTSHKEEKRDTQAWDYEGRSWYLWVNIFARAYGWDMGQIAELDIDDAFALSQEIFVDDQLDREWEWSLSEMAYPYDSTSKTSKFTKLPRPVWMDYKPQQAPDQKKVRILISMLPVGVVKRYEQKPS